MIAELFLLFIMMCRVEARCHAKWCDPNYLPYPNMDQALHGYDISKADPFTSGVTAIGDPGWRSQIFVPTVYKDGKVHIGERIDAYGSLGCSSCRVSTVASIREYKELQLTTMQHGGWYGPITKLGSNLDIPISLEGPNGYGSFGNSTSIPVFQPDDSGSLGDSDAKIRDFFQRGGAMAIVKCGCAVSTVGVYPNLDSQYHPLFKQGVKQLWSGLKTGTTAKQTAALEEFTRKFGTYYSSKTIMGSRMVYQLRLPKDQLSSKNRDDVIKCFDAKRMQILGLPVDAPAKADCDFGTKTLGIPTERFSAFGPKPPRIVWDPEWATAAQKSPAPIELELQPVLNLLSDDSLVEIFRNFTGVTAPTRAAFLEKLKSVWGNLGKIYKKT